MKKTIEPQTLKEWRADTGRTQRVLADELNLPVNYISLYETGRQAIPEMTKETFRKRFPGYDVIEMRTDDPATEFEAKLEVGEEMAIEEMKPTKPLTKIIHILRRDGEAYAYLSYAQALDELSQIILGGPETYGWSIEEAELR